MYIFSFIQCNQSTAFPSLKINTLVLSFFLFIIFTSSVDILHYCFDVLPDNRCVGEEQGIILFNLYHFINLSVKIFSKLEEFFFIFERKRSRTETDLDVVTSICNFLSTVNIVQRKLVKIDLNLWPISMFLNSYLEETLLLCLRNVFWKYIFKK